MKNYTQTTWGDINKYGPIRPVAGLNAVSTVQVSELLGISPREIQAVRGKIMEELKNLGMFTASVKQIAKQIRLSMKMEGCQYTLLLDNGETTVVPCGPLVYYTAPALAMLIDYRLGLVEDASPSNAENSDQNGSKAEDAKNPPRENLATGSGEKIHIMNVQGIDCYEQEGTVYLRLETVARGLGFTRIADSGNEVVRWERVDKYLADLGVPTCGHDSFIPENVFYRLAMRAKNATAEAFQAKIADEVIPSIRKYGVYATAETAERLMNDPDFMIRTFTALKEEREKRIALENYAAALEESNHALDRENHLLAREAQTWDKRSILVRLVRQYAHDMCCGDFRTGWNVFFRELYYKKGINLKSRPGDGKVIDKISDKEWDDAVSTAAAMCRANGIDMVWAVNATNARTLEVKV